MTMLCGFGVIVGTAKENEKKQSKTQKTYVRVLKSLSPFDAKNKSWSRNPGNAGVVLSV